MSNILQVIVYKELQNCRGKIYFLYLTIKYFLYDVTHINLIAYKKHIFFKLTGV